jgi:predicted permease
MLGRSLGNLEHQDFGYETHGRVVISVNALPATYTVPKVMAIYRRLLQRLKAIPGVRGAGLALYNPLTDNWGEGILVAGHPPPAPEQQNGASWDRVTTEYIRNLGIPLLRGRDFRESDNENSEPVALVNQAFVKRFFPTGEDPLDKHFGLDLPENAATFRIIGIVKDAKFAGFALSRPARPMFYALVSQFIDYPNPMMKRLERASHSIRGAMLVTDVPPGVLEPQVRKAMSEVDPNFTVNSVRTMEQQISLSFDHERSVATLAGLFGVIALFLAAVGIYGVTAYAVARRTPEIGIRMALGADRLRVLRLVLRECSHPVAIGLFAGIPLALVAGRLISAELYSVVSWDPLALAVAAGSLILSALLAAIVPASRAASISPMNALRTE